MEKVNGTLFNVAPSIYRSKWSPEVDSAWRSIAAIKTWAISAEDIEKLGKDPSKTIKMPDEFGFGPDKYAVSLDIQHNLHCLNYLRKHLNYDYYYRTKFGDRLPILDENHRDHCIDILRQTLMCYSSLDLVTYNWVEGQPGPFPDFNINRRCRDHKKLLEWQEEAFIADEIWLTVQLKETEFILPPRPGFDEWMAKETKLDNTKINAHQRG